MTGYAPRPIHYINKTRQLACQFSLRGLLESNRLYTIARQIGMSWVDLRTLSSSRRHTLIAHAKTRRNEYALHGWQWRSGSQAETQSNRKWDNWQFLAIGIVWLRDDEIHVIWAAPTPPEWPLWLNGYLALFLCHPIVFRMRTNEKQTPNLSYSLHYNE